MNVVAVGRSRLPNAIGRNQLGICVSMTEQPEPTPTKRAHDRVAVDAGHPYSSDSSCHHHRAMVAELAKEAAPAIPAVAS